MSKFIPFFCTLIFCVKAISAPEFEFIMDCANREVFFGQKILCQFIISGSTDVVEVEVVKFPEFRGFWSENLSLRQGPIALVPVATPSGAKKQGLVGSYTISRMVDKKTSQIIPMKISVKKRTLSDAFYKDQGEPFFLFSQSIPFKMLPLPPIPSQLSQIPFIGAVGEFSIPQPELLVSYRIDEPTQLRISLQGHGNFSEINSLPLSLPENSEILSRRNFIQSSGDENIKTFEYSILLKNLPPESYSLGAFLFFDSNKKIYRTLHLPEVKFSKAPLNLKENISSFQLPPPEKEWKSAFFLFKSFSFWAVQIVLLILSGFKLLKSWRDEKETKRRASHAFKREQMWNQALSAQQMGESEKFVKLATLICIDFLKEKCAPMKIRVSNYPTQKQWVGLARVSLSPKELAPIEKLFEHYEALYSPNPGPQPMEPLTQLLASNLKVKK